MLKLFVRLQDKFLTIRNEQSGQDAFEYLLVIGAVSVGVIIAMATPVGTDLSKSVVKGTCTAVKGVMPSVTCPA